MPAVILSALLVQMRWRRLFGRLERTRRLWSILPTTASILAGVVLATISSHAGGARQSVALAQAQTPVPTAAASHQITISDSGFQPASLAIDAGDSIHWTNLSALTQSVVAADGSFDSADLPPGAGFSVTLGTAGTYAYRSSATPSFSGDVRVLDPALTGLLGPPNDPAKNHIPAQPFPPDDPSQYSQHPTLLVLASRTRILVGFSATATVAQANAALANAGVLVLGGIPSFGTLLVSAPDTPDFSAVNAAVASLRADANVEFAAFSNIADPSVVPSPAQGRVEAAQNWRWEVVRDDAGRPLGRGGNWGLETARFPQAWNLLEVISRGSHSVDTVDLDSSFDTSHTDLRRLQLQQLCTTGATPRCTVNGGTFVKRGVTKDKKEHGTHTAGTMGADWNNGLTSGRSLGVSGANPTGNLYGVANGFNATGSTAMPDTIAIFGLVLDAVQSGTLPKVRVINWSYNIDVPDGLTWWTATAHRTSNCGPGPADDTLPGSALPCTPNTDDAWLAQAAANGAMARAVATRAGLLKVTIVEAAGNDGLELCSGPKPSGICTSGSEPINTAVTAPFAWAASNWTTGPGIPLIVGAVGDSAVNADGPSLQRASFSNLGGQVSAPGVNIVSTLPGSSYGPLSGTSMAAPHATALMGYLMSFDPTLTADGARDRIIRWAQAPLPGSNASPRIDAYAALMSLPGAAKAMVDVNDGSADGNQRVIRTPDKTKPNGVAETDVLGPGPTYTQPDGRIDMRDFRRFRDAWLQVCATVATPEASCPPAASIILDGAPGHFKKDLNFDGCVEPVNFTVCPTPETDFARFDFNGDGDVSRTRPSLVPIKPDGTPAADPSQATLLTDLGVLQTQFSASPAETEGWSVGSLDRLMESGDLEIHATDLINAAGPGVTEVDVTVRRTAADSVGSFDETLPPRTMPLTGEPIIVSAPLLTPATDRWEVRGTAVIGSGPTARRVESQPFALPLGPGEDRRVDLCAARVALTSDLPSAVSRSNVPATITATLTACSDDPKPLANVPVMFSMTPAGPTHATLVGVGTATDDKGVQKATFTPGSVVQAYTIVATADLGSGRTAVGQLTFNVVAPIKIAYRWTQTTLDFSETGTTAWAIGLPFGCSGNAYPYTNCIMDYLAQPFPGQPNQILERSGTLQQGAGTAVSLTEQLGQAVNQYDVSFKWLGQVPTPGQQTPHAIVYARPDHPGVYTLPVGADVSVAQLADRVELRGLSAVAELHYPTNVEFNRFSGELESTNTNTRPVFLNAVPAAQLIVPRGDGSALQFADDVSKPIAFKRRADGTFEPYTYCGMVDHSYTTAPGYSRINPFHNLYDPLPETWPRYGTPFGDSGPPAGRAIPQVIVLDPVDQPIPDLYGSAPVTLKVLLGAGGWPAGTPITIHGEIPSSSYGPFQISVQPKTLIAPGIATITVAPPIGAPWFNTIAGVGAVGLEFPVDATGGGITYHAYARVGGRTPTGLPNPAPTGPGHLKVRYAFSAVAVNGDTPADAVLPDCAHNQPPKADFSMDPVAPQEGQLVHFMDRSTDPENDIRQRQWKLPDGSTSLDVNPTFTFPDNGTGFTVSLTVLDAEGASDSMTKHFDVANVPPTAQMSDVSGRTGSSTNIPISIGDQGPVDAASLKYTLSSPDPTFVALTGTLAAGVHTLAVAPCQRAPIRCS